MAVLYRVNMSDLSVRAEESPDRYRGLGGRALTSTIVHDEVPPTCHPLSAENKLVLAPGILTGTGAPCSGRISAGAKSPLTGTIKEANSGGTGAQALAALGIQALVIEGKPEAGKLYRLRVTAEGILLDSADAWAGLGNYDTVASQFEEFGPKVSCLSIGQAGEMKSAAATIAVTDPEQRPTRHCGRGGLGAVMGSKGVKVIVVDPADGTRTPTADPEGFKAGLKQYNDALMRHPLTSETLPTYGTNALTNVINEAGGYPTNNFSRGQFDGAEAISGEAQHDTILERDGVIAHGCHRGCTIKCSRIYHDEDGNYLTKGPEYETVWAHGGNCGIDDLDAIARMDRLDDDFGVDTIEIGATIAVAMEAGVIPFGDADGAIRLVEEIGRGTPLGRLVASGADCLGKAYGVARIPTVKGQAMPAYDPRAMQGIGVTYATSTMGADHTAGYAIGPNILGVGGKVDPLSPEGQAELSQGLQIATAAIDSAGLCLFVAFAVLDDENTMEGICRMLAGKSGSTVTGDDVLALGRQVLTVERAFNEAAGFGPADDRLPDFFRLEKLEPHKVTFTVSNADLDSVYETLS